MNDLETLHDAWGTPEAPSGTAHAQARAALLARATSGGDHGHRSARRRLRPPRVRVRLLAVGASAMAIAAGVTLVGNVGGTDVNGRPRPIISGLPTGPVANAAEALERAAVAAETRPFTAPRADQWIYTEDRITWSAGPRRRAVSRGWRRADGSQWASIENGRLRIWTRERRAPSLPWDYTTMSALPTDPGALLRWAYQHGGGAGEAEASEVYNLFNAILRNGGVLPPRLEAAIFRAMKQIPGVTLVDGTVSVSGRPTLALGRVQDGWLYEQVLLDRQTYAYRGERSVVLTDHNPKDPSLEKGTVVLGVRIAAAIVDEPGQRR